MPEPRTAFFKDDFVPLADARVSVRCKGLNYGLGCFEGIRAYWGADQDQLFVFRAPEHYARLLHSCRILGIKFATSIDRLLEITRELLKQNECREDTYVRPLVFNDSEMLSPIFTDADNTLTMYTLPLKDYLDTSKGVTACVSSWVRINDNMIPARAKPTAAYLNSALARAEAEAAGSDEAIFLTKDGFVSEGSAEHLFIVRDGVLITPASQDDNLDGITRQTICEIAPADLGRRVETRRVTRTELYIADEMFFCGTGAQIAPVTKVDSRQVADGKVGPVTKALQRLYLQVVKNQVPKYAHWCMPVY